MPTPKLLEQVRIVARLKHYSYRTEQSYVSWIRRFILFHNKRHPREMAESEIRQFLAHLAINTKVSASTQTVALSALLFLYRDSPQEGTSLCRPHRTRQAVAEAPRRVHPPGSSCRSAVLRLVRAGYETRRGRFNGLYRARFGKAAEAACGVPRAMVTSRKTAGLTALRASRLKAACVVSSDSMAGKL